MILIGFRFKMSQGSDTKQIFFRLHNYMKLFGFFQTSQVCDTIGIIVYIISETGKL